jgi:signal transduction histidine kinase
VVDPKHSADVLIVDDEPDICMFMGMAVRSIGGRDWPANSVAAAKVLLAERDFAVALLDKNLPDGSGIELLKLIKERTPSTEVMLITGYANVESAVEALRLGAFDYLVKPFDVEMLVHRLSLAIERRRMLTDNSRMQRMLVDTDRMASIGTLAAGVAHEINNPLAFMLSNLEFVEAELPKILDAMTRAGLPAAKAEAVDSAIRDSREGAERVRTIVRDLKTFARSGEDALAPIDVERTLQSALKMAWFQIRHRARLDKQLARVPEVDGNEARLAQVFLNLLVNAAQAIPEGRASENEIRVTTRLDDAGRVEVVVRDTGCGIPPEVAGRIFDPFFTTKPAGEGTGLGLAICRDIVTSMGGAISVETQVGVGTAFTITLPRSMGLPQEVPTKPGPLNTGRRAKVLVVDDEPLIGISVTRLLTQWHDVSAEVDARVALERIRAGETFDVILCDVHMPTMTGLELFAELTQFAPQQADRMLFITGGTIAASAREFLETHRKRRIDKPFGSDALRVAIAKMAR